MVDRPQLDAMRSQADADRLASQAADKHLSRIEIKLQQLTEEIADMGQQLGPLTEQSLSIIEQACARLKREIQQLEQQQEQLADLDQQLAQIASAQLDLQQQLSTVQLQHEADRSQALTDQAALTHISKEIPENFRERSQLKRQLTRLDKTIEDLLGAVEAARLHNEKAKTLLTQQQTSLKDLDQRLLESQQQAELARSEWTQRLQESDFDHESAFVESQLNERQQSSLADEITFYMDQKKALEAVFRQQQKELEGKQPPDITAIDRRCEETAERYRQAEQVWHGLDARVSQLQAVQKKLQQTRAINQQLEERYAIYGTLSDVANGRTGNKISLQRFVLSVLLDDVLIQASQRLSLMSKGRYILLRKDSRAKGNKASGLELDVEDAYTGKSRSVATLSGGESFMAALALALGLSDVVQAYAGGIRLDMLFIDEGFGSLDQESLDLAIRTLVDLRASGRMIGIISHVSELKEQMALRLDVMSSLSGSRVKIVTV